MEKLGIPGVQKSVVSRWPSKIDQIEETFKDIAQQILVYTSIYKGKSL